MDSAPPPSPTAGVSLVNSFSSSPFSSVTEQDVNQGSESDRRFNNRFAGFTRRVNSCMACGELSMSFMGLALTFWLMAATAIMLGVYGPNHLWIGPNTSLLVEPSSFLVQSVKVKDLYDSNSELQLFGFYESPPRDVTVNWSESRLLSISRKSSKGWTVYMNEGTSLNISYKVKPEGSLAYLVVDEGTHGSSVWSFEKSLDDYKKSALSWNLIQGSGMVEVNISKSSRYYINVANTNLKDVKVELDIDERAVLYDTKQSFYKCTFNNSECRLNAVSLFGNYVVLTSPAPRQGVSAEEEEWYIRFTYEPRWIAYAIITGLVAFFTLVVIQVVNGLVFLLEEIVRTRNESRRSMRALLLANKDDDDSSTGSCDEPFAPDDADLDEFMGNDGDAKRLCAICFDAPRDCFFLPCGHCVSCYECGTKIVEEATGSCPICRRRIKKVKRIFTV